MTDPRREHQALHGQAQLSFRPLTLLLPPDIDPVCSHFVRKPLAQETKSPRALFFGNFDRYV